MSLTGLFTDIANAIRTKKGTTDLIPAQNFASEIESIESGGGGSPIQNSGGKYIVRVVDYNGIILKEDWLNMGDTFTMPTTPTHDRLVFQEWSSPVDIINNAITVPNYDVIIGPLYNTKSGLSEFDVEVSNASGLTINFKITGSKDWGDGTTDSEITHTYSSAGKYTIKMNITTIDTTTGNFMGVNRDIALKQAFLSSNVTTIGDYAFYYLYGLENISLPKKITRIGSYAFQYCYLLEALILPNVEYNTRGESYMFASDGKLKNVVIPKGWDFHYNVGNQFNTCSNLEYITLPSGVQTYIGQYCFAQLSRVYNINILGDIKTIGSNAFQGLFVVKNIRFLGCTSVPPLNNSTYFSTLSKNCRIIVPDNLYNSWKTATNWSKYASQIYKLSEVQ